jgi:hypothetical protein
VITEAVRDGKGIDGYPLGECLVYHWSPTSRRESILARGLRIRSVSTHSPVRYPFVCFSPSPLWAWDMSAGTFETAEVSWDLWAVWTTDLAHGFEVIPWDDGTPREVRTYRSVPARVVRYVATRLV